MSTTAPKKPGRKKPNVPQAGLRKGGKVKK